VWLTAQCQKAYDADRKVAEGFLGMEYSKEQVAVLQELRKRFFELGFGIYNLKRHHRKHELEFTAARSQDETFDSAIVRLFRGKVRIQFFEFHAPLSNQEKEHITTKIHSHVIFAKKSFNPTRYGNKQYWDSVVYLKELYETDPLLVIKRAGVHIQRGFPSAQSVS